MSFIMQRTISPQLAISASLSVLAMAVFTLFGPVAAGSGKAPGADAAAFSAELAKLPVVGQLLQPSR